VESPVGRPLDADQFGRELRRAFAGELRLGEELARRANQYERLKRPAAARPADPRVLIDRDPRGIATIVQVRAADRIGLLHAMTTVLAEHGLDIRNAKISTLGHEVVDTFYVVTVDDGHPIDDAVRLHELVLALLHVLPASSGPREPRSLR
jgi:[protein-PII] uridylyltransferase